MKMLVLTVGVVQTFFYAIRISFFSFGMNKSFVIIQTLVHDSR